jgi:hypothetical protein
VVVAAGERRSARRRAHRRHVIAVVGEAALGDARHVRRRDRAAEGARVAEAGVVDQHEEDVRRALGRRRSHHQRPVGDRLVEGAAARAAEVRVGDRQDRAIGVELAHGLAERRLEAAQQALLVGVHEGLGRGARQRLLDRQPVLLGEHGDDPSGAWRERLAHLVVEAALELVVGELAHDAAGGGADDHRGKQGRREQADHEADAAAPPETLATGVVAGVQEGDAAVLLVRDEDDALDLDLLRLDELAHAVEVLVCGVDVLVGSYQYVHGAVAHGVSLVPRDLAVVGVRSVVAEPPPDRDPVAVRMGSLSRQRWPACVTCHRGTRGLHAVDRPALSVAAAEAVRGASCRRRRWPSAPLRRDRSRTRASWSSPERRVPVLRTRRRDR